MFVWICQDQNSDGAKAFTEVAGDIDDVVFGVTSDAAVFSEYQISDEAVVLFKNVRSLLFAVIHLSYNKYLYPTFICLCTQLLKW